MGTPGWNAGLKLDWPRPRIYATNVLPPVEPSVVKVAEEVERRFEGRGRIVLRASGTEPLIRVMVEGYDAGLVKQGARDIAAVVEAAAAQESGA